MTATRRGVAVVQRASPEPANDNDPKAVTPDDRRFFLSLALVSAVILALALYVALSPPADDVMTLLRR